MSLPKELIGEKVYHKLLKLGSIVNFTGQHILVRFEHESNEQKPHKFQFPDIMFDERNLMSTDSVVINDYLKTIKIDHTCFRCGKQVISNLSLTHHHFCRDCISQMVCCSECGNFFDADKCIKDHCNNYFCKSCAENTRFFCSSCKSLLPISELIQSPFIPKDQKICESCIDWMDYISCTSCGAYAPDEIIEEIDETNLCPHCKENKTGDCHICGKLTILQDNDTAIICSECKQLISHQEHIDRLDFSTLKIASIPFSTFKESNTRTLMSRLRHSYGEVPADKNNMPIDILLIETYYGALVVCYDASHNSQHLHHYGCTLTKLKQGGYFHLFHGNTCVIKREIFVPFFGKTFYVWERPYQLNAQTVSDMNYGDRWEGQYLVYEGNKYGDTSTFDILGFIK